MSEVKCHRLPSYVPFLLYEAYHKSFGNNIFCIINKEERFCGVCSLTTDNFNKIYCNHQDLYMGQSEIIITNIMYVIVTLKITLTSY